MLAHFGLHIPPGVEDALAPDALHLVHDAVEDPHAHIGHADLIGIREAEGHIDPDGIRILLDLIEFAAGVARRLLHAGQDSM